MKTPLPCLCAALALLATASVTVTRADPVTLTGDHVINPGPDDTGSLTVSGQLHVESNHADLGTTGDGQIALLLTYQENGATRQVVVYAARSAVEYLWKEGSTDASTATPKMTLGADNTLTLHDTTGASTITLTPATGEISAPGGFRLSDGTLIANQSSLRSTALYNASDQIVAQVGEDGRVTFANGLIVGSNPDAALTANSTAYLNTVLQNLGFQENPVEPTHVDGIITGSQNSGSISIVYDTAGNQYLAGTFSGSSVKIGNSTIYGSSTTTNQFVLKRTPAGTVSWNKVWYVSGAPQGIVTDASGNIYVVGYLSSTAGKSISLAGVSVTAQGGNDGYVLKLNNAGAAQWVKVIGGTGSESAKSVTVDASGNVFVIGSLNGTAGQAIGLAGVSVTAQGSNDGFVLKLNSAGVGQWAKVMGSTNSDYAEKVVLDSSGNVYVSGYVNQTANQTVNLAGISVTAQGGNDGYVLKLNSAGAGQWAKILGHSNSDYVRGLAVDGSGNVYVAGELNRTANQTVNLAGITVTAQGNLDGYVLKLNSAGAGQWAKILGHSSSDYLKGLAVDGSGNVYVVGNFSRTAGQTVNLAGITVTAKGNQDGYVLKLNTAGAGQWARIIGHTDSDYTNGLALDAANNIYIFGYISASEGTPLDMAGVNVNAISYANGYILKLDNAGASLWTKLIPAEINRITLSPSNEEIVLSGYSTEENFTLGDTLILGNWMPFFVTLPISEPIIDVFQPAAASIAWGNAMAPGSNAIAMGDNAFAIGPNTISLGYNSTATGSSSIAIGEYNRTTNYNATAVGGAYNTASGSSSFIGGGWGNTASGYGSVILGGEGNSANGDYSLAGGLWSSASGPVSVALGESGSASGSASTAIGSGNSASGDYTAAFGYYNQAQAINLFAIGRLNVAQGSRTAWVPSDDLFVIGNGDWDEWTYSNAFAVHKNGTTRSAGPFEAKGGIRIPPGGDVSMGTFTQGNDPSTLNAGLRYQGE
ncbi:calcium-binding protein [Opitutaceae bacterium TAV5]|nr:calcium-binding protein [Opitutaceae bacterium TAV5]